MSGKFTSLLRSTSDEGQEHRGSAFIIESLLLLVFVTASVAIVVQLLGDGYSQGAKAERLSTAVSLATNEAERFIADPTIKSRELIYVKTENGPVKVDTRRLSSKSLKKSVSADSVIEYEGSEIPIDDPGVYVLDRVIKKEELSSGNLYNVAISVSCQGEEVYSIDTSKYISNSKADDPDSDGTSNGEGGM